MKKLIYKFGPGVSEGDGTQKDLLGGKGAGLQEMAKLGLPVPPGFTVPCSYSMTSLKDPKAVIEQIMPVVMNGLEWLTGQFGYTPLVSVRSGAPVSCPGMMDTILNVGLTEANLPAWSKRIGERAALDSYRRLIQMLGATAFGIPSEAFETKLALIKKTVGVEADKDLAAGDLKAVIAEYKKVFQAVAQQPFPDDPAVQLIASVTAVWRSWNNERAVVYRDLYKISHDMGTAVTVQAMVFGNMNDQSGSGVLFTRNPSTGENNLYGEFLPNAQGEDVVNGSRTPINVHEMVGMGGCWDKIIVELIDLSILLEQHQRDMQDVEFTVQDGKLFVLQCRTGKREASAAFRIAVEMVADGLIDKPTALKRLAPAQYKVLKQPKVAKGFDLEPLVTGLAACGGVTSGRAVFSAEAAVEKAKIGPVILVSEETTPDDLAGMVAAQAVLTSKGGATSHAAVVARSMDKTCVVGCGPTLLTISEGDQVTVCGDTGRIWINAEVPVEGGDNSYVETVCGWIFELKGLVPSGPNVWELKGHKVRVSVADWLLAEGDPFTDFADALDQRGTEGVILDLSLPALEPDDLILWEVGCPVDGQIDQFLERVLKRLADYKLKGLTLLGLDPKLKETMEGYGYVVIDSPKTLADVLMADIVMPPSQEFIEKVCGSVAAWDKLRAMLEKDGKKIGGAPEGVHPEQALFAFLGK
jgi:pyruvate,phosphate dikinase